MIDEFIQQELRAHFNPEGSPLRKHQLKLLELLKAFDSICQQHGIRYWLSSGNCLGAVRHGGFIPWDDDVDVEMLRKDYDLLLKSFSENEDYAIQTHDNDLFYAAAYAKFRDKHSVIDEHAYGFTDNYADKKYKYRGVYIDVFCIEMTNKFLCHLSQYFSSRIIHLASITDQNNRYSLLLYRVSKSFFFYLLSFFRIIDRIIPGKRLRHAYGEGFYTNERDKRDIFPIKRTHFEYLELPIPNDADSYLKRIYGDYWAIPPLEMIRKPHVVKVDYLDNDS